MTLVNADFLRKIDKLAPDLKDVLYPMVELLEKPHEETVNRVSMSCKRSLNAWPSPRNIAN
jgi:hypothetical protein